MPEGNDERLLSPEFFNDLRQKQTQITIARTNPVKYLDRTHRQQYVGSMKNRRRLKVYACKFLFAALSSIVVTIPFAWAQDNPVSGNIIGLAFVKFSTPQITFTVRTADKLNADVFSSLDKNGDAAVSSAEFEAWSVNSRALFPPVSKRFMGVSKKQIFSAADANGDASVSLNEVQALSEFDFKTSDLNQSGILDTEEINALMPVILRLVPSKCPSLNTIKNGLLMGGFCKGQ